MEFLQRTRAAAPDADILVVDDNSPDGTADLADEVGRRLGQIEVLRRPRKIGIGDAVRAGFTIGLDRGYDIVVQIDADLSHDPAALPDLLLRDRTRRRRRDRLALRARRIDPALAVVPADGLEVGQPLRDARARHPDPRRDLGLPRVPRRHLEDRRLLEHALEGLRLPDRALLPRVAARRPHRAGADHVHRSRARPLEDVVERRRRRARARHVVGAAGPRAQGPLARCISAATAPAATTTSTPRPRPRR